MVDDAALQHLGMSPSQRVNVHNLTFAPTNTKTPRTPKLLTDPSNRTGPTRANRSAKPTDTPATGTPAIGAKAPYPTSAVICCRNEKKRV